MGGGPSKEKLEGQRIAAEQWRRAEEEYDKGTAEAYRQLELSDAHQMARYNAFLENQMYGTPIPPPLRTAMPLSQMPDYVRPYYMTGACPPTNSVLISEKEWMLLQGQRVEIDPTVDSLVFFHMPNQRGFIQSNAYTFDGKGIVILGDRQVRVHV